MLTHFTNQQIADLEERKRIAMINSLSGFKSLNLIGTVNKEGQTNLSCCLQFRGAHWRKSCFNGVYFSPRFC